MSESYHYGQGKIEIAERLAEGLGPWTWIGDVSEMSGAPSEESFTHQESYSGKKGSVRKIYLGKTLLFNLTMFQLDTENLARFMQGTATSQSAGTVSAESLGTVTGSSIIQLAHYGVSDLVITDSADPTPATIAASHYDYDEFGTVTFKSLPNSPAPTMPLSAAYSHSAYNQAAFFNADRKEYAVRFKGINLAEGDKKVLVEFYKCSAGLLNQLSLITNGNQLASAQVQMEALLDTSKPASGSLGQYGRQVTIGY